MTPIFNTWLKPQKEWMFLPVFISIYLSYLWLSQQSIQLTDFQKGTVSLATLNTIDISRRVSLYYRSVFILTGLFFVFTAAINLIRKRSNIDSSVMLIINALSFIGIVFLYTGFVHGDHKNLLDFLLITIILVIVQEIILIFFYRTYRISFKKDLYLWALLMSLSMLIAIRNLFLYVDWHFGIATYYQLFVILILGIINLYFILEKRFSLLLHQFMNGLKPVAWLAVVPVLSIEISYFIANRLNFEVQTLYILVGLYTFLLIWLILRRFKKTDPPQARQQLKKYYAPLFVISFTLIVFYNPVIEQPTEIYELANPANSVLRVFEFGEIPMVDFLSSHLLSEQLFSYLYIFIHGYDGTLGFMSYQMLIYVVSALTLYYFFQFVFRNIPAAIFLTLFFPFVLKYASISVVIILISVLLYYKLSIKHTFYYLLLSFFWLIFSVLWKPEIGLANLYLSVIFFMVHLLTNNRKNVLADYSKAAGLFAGIGIITFLILSAVSNSDILSNIQKAYLYFTANQAHGRLQLTYNEGRLFHYHYYIFPVLVLAMVLWLVFNYKKLHGTVISKRMLFAVLFLAGFYFIHAQRGLVRHNMFENTMRISSVLFLILSLFAVISYPAKRGSNYLYLFIAISVILISNFSFPENEKLDSFYGEFAEKVVNMDDYWPSNLNIESRVHDPQNFKQKNFGSFTTFLNENIGDESTFYDFSNTPMMYFYTKRKIPSYFNQMPICVINEPLQQLHLNDMNKYDMPVATFSNVPQNFWDKVDGVPNEMRHYLIAYWLYQNYLPYAIIDDHTVWLHKNHAASIEERYEEVIKEFSNGNELIVPKSTFEDSFGMLRISFDNPGSYLPEITVGDTMLRAYRSDAQGNKCFLLDSNKIGQYMHVSSEDSIKKIQLVKLHYIPDTISHRLVQFELKKLAFVEGQYDNYAVIDKINLDSRVHENDALVVHLHVSDSIKTIHRKYLEIECNPVNKNIQLVCQYGVQQMNLGEFSFEILNRNESLVYHIPLYTQLNWNKFDIDFIRIFSKDQKVKMNMIKNVSLINKE